MLSLGQAPAAHAQELAIGSKTDIEGEILGNMLAELAESAGTPARYRRTGGTQIVFQALKSGALDAYPEYTGTLTNEIFAAKKLQSADEVRAALGELGLAMSKPLGFNNSYAIGMKEDVAARLNVRTISDLAKHPELRLGFSNEFMGRADGWAGLKQRYRLPFAQPRGSEHAVLYAALNDNELDAIELYSTDSKIARYGLRALEDDLGYFPKYEAVILYRQEAARRAPAAIQAMLRLEGQLSQQEMIALNKRVEDKEASPHAVAADFLAAKLGVRAGRVEAGVWQQLLIHAWEHIVLVTLSLAAAIVVAVPLGVLAARHARFGQVALAVTGLLQTIPSLALLIFMIPLLGLGEAPTIAALFLYSLLPIVRNTHAGLHGISASLRESAEALGLSNWARLRLIELPLASQTILAGIKTAAVINVGTATIGGLIGAGGFGQPILTGITLDDRAMILWQGAVPAAVLALIVQGLFDLSERYLVPAGLRVARVKE